jgi:hypothetical protein
MLRFLISGFVIQLGLMALSQAVFLALRMGSSRRNASTSTRFPRGNPG